MTTGPRSRLAPRAPLAATLGILLLSAPASADLTFNVASFTPTASIIQAQWNTGGDHLAEFSSYGNPAPLGITTSLPPVLATMNSPFIVGNFDGAPPTTQSFQTAFAAWNAANGGGWTLINGGHLDVTLSVTDTAYADHVKGGIDPFRIDLTLNPDYTGPTLAQLIWTQALYISVQPPLKVDTTTSSLDTYSVSMLGDDGVTKVPIPGSDGGTNTNTTPSDIPETPQGGGYVDPIYPFQYDDKHFFDAPKFPWPDESFRAITLLSTVTFKTDILGNITERDLTVYDGVSWGFDLAIVPEPSSYALLATALAGLLARAAWRSGWRSARRPRSGA